VLNRFTDGARRTIDLASEEARALGHGYVGPEHLLLALLDDATETGSVLRSAGLQVGQVRTLIDWIVVASSSFPADLRVPISDRAQRVLVRATRLSGGLGRTVAGTDELLLAMTIDGEGVIDRVFEDLSVDLDALRDELIVQVSGDDAAAADCRELVVSMREAQAAGHGVDPFADEPPDLLDGLIEADRQVLAALPPLGSLRRRSDRVVGGDHLLYARLVRMAQDWVCRYPLVDGLGNFGSIYGFSPAGMDYTEARPASLAEEIDAFPLLLANGGPGIPPHNLAAVISTTVAYLDDPAISTAALIAQLTGPDFPTGGVVINGSALPAIYETGEGSILLRGRAKIEASGSERMIVITELPYTVSAAWDGGLIEQIADSVRGGSLAGISDLHDDSSNDNGMQIVLELAPSSDPDATVDALYKQTDLEIAYQVRMVAAVDGTPRTLALRELIAEWVASRLRDQPKDAVRERLLAVAERHRDPRRTAIT
jgi:hypothetical protein